MTADVYLGKKKVCQALFQSSIPQWGHGKINHRTIMVMMHLEKEATSF